MSNLSKNYDKERHQKDSKKKAGGNPIFLTLLMLIWASGMSWLTCWLASALHGTGAWFGSPVSYQFLDGKVQPGMFDLLVSGWSFSNFGNYAVMHQYPKLWWGIELLLTSIMLPLTIKSWYRWRPNKANQYGNDRLTTEKEIYHQYPQITDREYRFPGYGGIPVAHSKPVNSPFIKSHPIFWAKYYLCPQILQLVSIVPGLAEHIKFIEPAHGFYSIDQTTVNSLIVGITRSGKGETLVMPLVDILSRGEKQSSMVINDPKGELYQASYETLKKRGYDVQVLNIEKTDFSMSYNPLQNIINYAKDGYYDEVQQEVNTFSSSIYTDPTAKDKFWQNSSINLLNALILAVIDHAKRNNNWKEVTMDNVLHMMTNLGSKQVNVNKDGDIIPSEREVAEDPENIDMPEDNEIAETKNKLIVYFAKLQELNQSNFSQFRQMALDAFAQSKFAGEETAGNIYSSAMEGIKIYQQIEIEKLTSMNSLDFESIGFPRYFKLKLPQKFQFNTAVIEFEDSTGKQLEKGTQIIDKLGIIHYTIETKLPDKFKVKVSLSHRKNNPEFRNQKILISGFKRYERNGLSGYKKDPYTHEPLLKDVKLVVDLKQSTFDSSEMTLHYSEKPVALFMCTPPNNPSYNQLPAFAIDQIFNTLYKLALANGRKVFRRVHFILDEFGGLPTINEMSVKLQIGAGQGLLFDIVVQNLEQLELKYSAQQAATIQSNCSNLLYILTKSKKTAETISSMIGKRTVEVDTKSGKVGDIHGTNYSSSFISQDILSAPDLMKLMGGEMVVLRSVYRQDQKGHDVSAMPIFDHGKTAMPYRNTFLQREFSSQTTLADIGIKSPHRSLDLHTLRIDFDNAYNQVIDLIHQNDDESGENDPAINFAQKFTNTSEANGSKDKGSLLSSNKEELLKDDPNDYLTSARQVPENAVLNWDELRDPELTEKVTVLLYRFLYQLYPKQLRLRTFDRTSVFWLLKRNNNWEAITEWFGGNQEMITKFRKKLTEIKQEAERKEEIKV